MQWYLLEISIPEYLSSTCPALGEKWKCTITCAQLVQNGHNHSHSSQKSQAATMLLPGLAKTEYELGQARSTSSGKKLPSDVFHLSYSLQQLKKPQFRTKRWEQQDSQSTTGPNSTTTITELEGLYSFQSHNQSKTSLGQFSPVSCAPAAHPSKPPTGEWSWGQG